MMKLVDMLGLGSSEETLEGSSPSILILDLFYKINLIFYCVVKSVCNYIQINNKTQYDKIL